MDYIVKKNKYIHIYYNDNNYNFTCFEIIKEYINITDIYNILNSCNLIDINNILNYINLKWNKIQLSINSKFSDNPYKSIKFKGSTCKSFNEFNDILLSFINNNIILAFVCWNIMINNCII